MTVELASLGDLLLHTASLRYEGPDRVDVSPRSHDALGRALAPSEGVAVLLRGGEPRAVAVFAVAYRKEMLASYRAARPAWAQLAGLRAATLCCGCEDPQACHRTLLAAFLAKLGARYEGER